MKYLSLSECDSLAKSLAARINYYFTKPLKIYGHPRGGISTMYLVSKYIVPPVEFTECVKDCDLIIDDIYDTGKTEKLLSVFNKPIMFLIDKRVVPFSEWAEYVVFPWEDEWKVWRLKRHRSAFSQKIDSDNL